MSDKMPTHSRPIMRLLDLLSRRWTLRIIWELRGGPQTSRSLREAIQISPTVLQARVNELREAGIIELEKGTGYAMTAMGAELAEAFAPLSAFARRWANAVDDLPADTNSDRSASG